MREEVFHQLKSDIYCLSETHLNQDGTLMVDGYVSFNHNRQIRHKNAPKASGGVSVLVKDSVFSDFAVKVIDRKFDGILGIELENKHTGFTIVLFCCYLSPDNSVWGREPTSFFAHLITQIYIHNEADCITICGDLNGRVGSIPDIVEGIDDIPPRSSIDKIKSGHGEALLEFVKDTKLAIVNGRINPERDNFTFVSPRGKSVVDYFITPHDCLKFCDSFQVDLVSDILQKFGLYELFSTTCKAPDHSLLTLNLHHTYIENTKSDIDAQCNEKSSETEKVVTVLF